MTTVKVFYNKDSITEVECKGHTGYAKVGKDIVCASVSSIVQTALLGLYSLTDIDIENTVGEGYLHFKINAQSLQSQHDSNIILKTMLLGVKDLASGYGTYIKLEETKNVY